MAIVHLGIEDLKQFMRKALLKAEIPADDVEIVVDVLIRSDIRGTESHGIGRLKMYLDFIKDGVQTPFTKIDIVRETPGTALLDANSGMGHVVSHKAMTMAIDKARNVGIGAVAVRNSTHFGICGYYPLMAAKAGMMGWAFTNARPSIPPTFGNDPMFGTNPIAFSAPTDEGHPFILDMATSIIQRGKVEVSERAGKPIASGLVIDREGHYHTDAAKILQLFNKKEAALLALGGLGEETGGHKGYGLAMMVEILSSSISGGPFCWGVSGYDENGNKVPNRLGHFFMAVNIEAFLELDEFKKITGDMVRAMRASSKLPGYKRIYVAGEKGFERSDRILKEGVPINESLQKTMKTVRADYGFDFDLPF